MNYFKKNKLSILLAICSMFFQATLMAAERVYVAAEGTGNVVVIDASTNTIIKNIDVGTGTAPHNLVGRWPVMAKRWASSRIC